jgi:predicted protein tyrosine phosphatase
MMFKTTTIAALFSSLLVLTSKFATAQSSEPLVILGINVDAELGKLSECTRNCLTAYGSVTPPVTITQINAFCDNVESLQPLVVNCLTGYGCDPADLSLVSRVIQANVAVCFVLIVFDFICLDLSLSQNHTRPD